ncbi:MAG: RidA family protein [Candidatus Nanopelagicales bacterium]|jgi:enamine deaminase RidA (YjgF/YER057c/UK114 family)|nr:RidA family protein [Candidatus Nanopelagicales bacterium]
MSAVEDRLSELGLTLPEVAAPVAAYVPAVRTGNLIYTSGQLPMVNGALPETGTVGVNVTVDRANELASICALNAMAAIKALIGDLDKVQRVIKVVGFVNSAPDFINHPAVVNGASNVLLAAFGDAGTHARSAIGVASLPLDAPVEVELIVEVAD